MPIQDCQIDEKPGVKWGEQGACYPYEDGNEESKKEAIQKAMKQAAAIGGGKVLEHARLIDVPVFRAGKHNGLEFSESEIDEMIDTANINREYLKESMIKGAYEGNNFQLDKPIPGVINLGHQRFLKDTIKDAVKDVSVNFGKKTIDGINWIVATFEGVKDDIAEFLASVFPLRSIEIIPELYNPKLNQTFRNVIRSVGFLDVNTAPAVSGQTPNFLMEFSQQLAVMYFSQTDDYFNQQPQEVNNMAEKDEKKKEEETISISIQEYERLQAERDKIIKEMSARLEKTEKEKEDMSTRLKLVEMARERADIDRYLESMKGKNASPAFLEIITPIIPHLDGAQVIEFSKEDKQSARQKIQEVFEKILEMAKKGALHIPFGEYAKQEYKDPTQEKEPDKATQQKFAIAEFQEAAKHEAKNPQDEREVYNIALQKATRKYGDKLFG